MILLCGIPSEPPLGLVIEAAEELGTQYALFNQREAYYSNMWFTVKNGKVQGEVRIREASWPLNTLSGIYVRLMDYRDLPEYVSVADTALAEERRAKLASLHESMADFLEITKSRVMNRPSDMGSNMSKPYQMLFIRKAGFFTPITLITNTPDEIRSFRRYHRRVIYKSISSVRSIVKELDDRKMRDVDKVRYLPTQFQAFVPGINIRVHVVGNEIFATEIRSEATDYRYAGQEGLDVSMAPLELPGDIATRCLTLSKMLNLPLCGIDLKRTPDGDFYCFEVNPSPGYSYYQENTGQNIARAIIEYLR